jgi:gamma-glutamylcyclotransferase (GGCT)/AIG2-like uncharacterized protein YtfP
MRPYFAYGSNMCDAQMKKRCPQHRKVGVARLVGYRWIVSARGYANLVESNESEVEGVLFEISASDEALLDGHEGVALGAYRKAELPILRKATESIALVYLDPVTAEGVPNWKYVERINAGIADAGLSEGYVTRQVRRFVPA